MTRKRAFPFLFIENELVDLLVSSPDLEDADRVSMSLHALMDIGKWFHEIKKVDPRLVASYIIVTISIFQNRDIFDEIGQKCDVAKFISIGDWQSIFATNAMA
jgi:hypothetical protein